MISIRKAGSERVRENGVDTIVWCGPSEIFEAGFSLHYLFLAHIPFKTRQAYIHAERQRRQRRGRRVALGTGPGGNFARRFNEEARRFFDRKEARTNGVVATKALAHKLARASYHVLKTKQPFDVKRCFV